MFLFALSLFAIANAATCQDFFFDFGANAGLVFRTIYEPDSVPNAELAEEFKRLFGGVKRRRRCVSTYAFEADWRYTETLINLEKECRAQSWNALVFTETKVGVRSGPATFDEPVRTDLLTHHNLREIDVSEIIGNLTSRRHQESVVVVKMDIEGREYLVLPRMFELGYLCREKIDALMIAWHDSLAIEPEYEPAKEFQEKFSAFLSTQECESTQIIAIDDDVTESYQSSRISDTRDSQSK